MKKILSVLTLVTYLTSVLCFPVYAYEDTSDPVIARSDTQTDEGRYKEVGSVTVVNNGTCAVEVIAAGGAYGKLDAEATVHGDVTLNTRSQNSVFGASVMGGDGHAGLTVDGDIVASGINTGTGAAVRGGYFGSNELGSADVVVNGDIIASSDRHAIGIDAARDSLDPAGATNVTIGRNVEAVGGYQAIGVENNGANITISGHVFATGSGQTDSCGVRQGLQSFGNSTVTVGEEVNVLSNGDSYGIGIDARGGTQMGGSYAQADIDTIVNGRVYVQGINEATGIKGTSEGGNFDIKVNGPVSVYSDGAGYGVLTNLLENAYDPFGADVTGNILLYDDLTVDGNNDSCGIDIDGDSVTRDSEINVQIDGNLESSGKGIVVGHLGEAVANVAIDGEIIVGDNAQAITVDNSANGDNLSITAWKVNGLSDQAIMDDVVHYFIHMTQPDIRGAGISLHEADGADWDDTIDWVEQDGTITQKARASKDDVVYVKLTIPAGYRLKSAYADDGKTALVKGDNGLYYFVMPKGGGINVNMHLELIRVTPAENNDEDEYSQPQTNDTGLPNGYVDILGMMNNQLMANPELQAIDLYFGSKTNFTLTDMKTLLEQHKHLIKRCHFDYMGKKYIMIVPPIMDETDYQNKLALFMAEPNSEAGFIRTGQVFGFGVAEE